MSNKLADLLLNHQWVEEDNTPLTHRDLMRLLAILPALTRSGFASTIELTSRLYNLKEHEIMLATLAEVDFEAEGLYDTKTAKIVLNTTNLVRTRLDLNKKSLLQISGSSSES